MTETSLLQVDDLEVTVIRKPMKNIYLRLKEGGRVIQVSCPVFTPDAEVIKFVRSRRDWIEFHQKQLNERPDLQRHSYDTGDTLPVWGEQWTLEVRPINERYAYITGDAKRKHFVLEIGDCTTEQREMVLEEWYKRELKRVLPAVVERCSKRSGLIPSGWTVRKMTSRWGSCNHRTRHLSINSALAKYPPQCLEMVVCHELTHIRVPNHSRDFYTLLESFCPNWREAHDILRGQKPNE